MKINVLSLIAMLLISNAAVLFILPINADENQPQWPTSWILYDIDTTENGPSDDFRDVKNAYYNKDDNYLYFRLECYGFPNFANYPKARYKIFIDIDDPHNMGRSGGTVYDAEYLIFVEDSSPSQGDGIGDVYLLNDVNNNGTIRDDWLNYLITPGPILDDNIAGYRIDGNCIDLYVRQTSISSPIYSYFTWATDNVDPNFDSSPDIDRSNNYWNENLAKADISIEKKASKETVYSSESYSYIIDVKNHGPNGAYNINVTDFLDPDVNFIKATPDEKGNNGLSYWWIFSSLGVDESRKITISVDANTIGVVNNTVYVYSNTYDPVLGNNEATVYITVIESFPVANFSWSPISPYEGVLVSFVDESTSFDELASWSWDFGDGGISNIKNPLHTYNYNGTYTVNLTVIDEDGSSDFISHDITVLDQAPFANFSWSPISPYEGELVLFVDESTSFDEIVSWSWDFGGLGNSSDQNPSFMFMKNGVYTVNLTIIDDDGSSDFISHNVTILYPSPGGGGVGYSGVTNLLPVADSNGPYYAFIGEEIEFNGTGSYDKDEGGKSIIQYDWKFFEGDNWHLNIGAKPKYIYNETGIYNVTLRVTDDEGSISVNKTTATITKPNLPPTNIIISGEVKGHQYISYPYDISASDPDGENITYTINWGDGSDDKSNSISNGIIYTINHIWNAPGDYSITVYAADEQDAQSDEVTINVLIDIIYVKDIGYLIDYDSDGTYDKFYSNKTKKETTTEKLNDGKHLINDDDDKDWEWIYNPDTDTLETYYYGEETDLTLFYLILIFILLCLITIILVIYKKKKKKEIQSETITSTQP